MEGGTTDEPAALVRSVLERYLYCLDAGDYAGLAACFTDDAELAYDVLPHRFVGGRALADWIAEVHDRTGSRSTHVLANARVDSTGPGVAAASSHVVATLARPVNTGYAVRVRGIRYEDELVETAEGWRIGKRTHLPQWTYDAEGGGLPMLPPRNVDGRSRVTYLTNMTGRLVG